ncbi:hypothetical protein HBH69_163050 [Parastagonospora nodorum]|nr:hypothetical protein HBH69_163050 [Parastagonospora nodorum]KAH5268600.1 hypothetical protein HBI72_069670 [Parastagonospora nodorum]
MSCFRALLTVCSPRPTKRNEESDPSLDGSYQLQALEPETLPTEDDSPPIRHMSVQSLNPVPAPNSTIKAQVTSKAPTKQHISATLSPRAIAALLKDVDFAQGGDERLPLHTFSADWDDGDAQTEADVQYEFIYEGDFGITWPLRKIRVDDMPVEQDFEDVDTADDTSATIDAHEVADRHDCRADVAYTHITPQSPRKRRVRVRIAGDTTAPRFKVRVRAPQELGNESMRRLPRRRGELVLGIIKPAMDEQMGR